MNIYHYLSRYLLINVIQIKQAEKNICGFEWMLICCDTKVPRFCSKFVFLDPPNTHLSKVSPFVYLMDIHCIICAQGDGALERPEDLWAEIYRCTLWSPVWGFSGTSFYRWIRLRLIYLHPSYGSKYFKNRSFATQFTAAVNNTNFGIRHRFSLACFK